MKWIVITKRIQTDNCVENPKTTEIYTHVAVNIIKRMESSLDPLNLNPWGLANC